MKTIKSLLSIVLVGSILIAYSQSQPKQQQGPQTMTTKVLLMKCALLPQACDTSKGKNCLLGAYGDYPPQLYLTIPMKADGKTPDVTIINNYQDKKDVFIWKDGALTLNDIYWEKGAEVTFTIIKNPGKLETHLLKKMVLTPGMKSDQPPKNSGSLLW